MKTKRFLLTLAAAIALAGFASPARAQIQGSSSGGMNYPPPGIPVSTGFSWGSPVTSTTVIGLFTGTCSSSTYLRGDGICATPAAGPTISTNGTNNASQTFVNFQTSTTNTVGLTVTPSNPGTGNQIFEVTGGSYTGNAATASAWATARNLAGNSVNGSANVAFANKFLAQGTSDSGLSGAQFLGALATGILKSTTTTGVVSIAASSDVIGLFSGTCSSSTYLRGDGSCQTPAGSVSTSGSPAQYQTAVFASGTTIAGIGPGTTGYPLVSGGASANPSFAQLASAGLSITTTSCTNQFVTAISAGGVGTCTTDTLASAQHANQGTTTTVLHGNASGNPSFAAITLSTDVTGQLPIASVGTSGLSGTVPVTISAAGAIACATCDTSAAALTSNAVVIGGGSQAESTISADTTTTHALFATAGAPAFRAIAGTDIPTLNQSTTANAGTATALASYTGYSVYGSSASAASWLTPTANGQCLMSGASSYATTTPSFQSCPGGSMVYPPAGIAVSTGSAWTSAATSTTIIGLFSGTCSSSTYLRGDGSCQTPSGGGNVSTSGSPAQYQTAVFASGTTIAGIGPGASGYPLVSGGASANPSFAQLGSAGLSITTTSCTNQFVTAISGGGVGTCTTDTLASAQHANQGATTTVLHGNASGNPSFAAVALSTDVSGQLPIANVGSSGLSGTAPVTISAAGAIACATCDTSAAALTSNAVVIGGGSQAESTISADTTTTHALFATAGAPAFRAIAGTDIPTLNQSTTANAGTATALASYTGYSVYGSSASAASWLTPTANGQCLMSGASSYATTTPSFQTCPSGGGTPSFPVTVGGTVNSGGVPYFSNSTTETSSALLTQYGVLFGGGAGGAPTASAQGAANMPLIGQGASNPIFSTIAYPTSLTSGGFLYASSTTGFAGSSLITANVLPKSGGAGTAPAASSITDNGTTVTTSEPIATTSTISAGSSPPSPTAGTGGGEANGEGTAPSVCPSATACLYADSTAHEYRAQTNGSSSPGLMVRSQPNSIDQTSQTGSISLATLCAASAGACNVAGQYEVHFNFWGSGTACSSVTAGKVIFSMTWTDEQGTSHSAIPLADMDQKSAGVAVGFFFNTTLATEGAGGVFPFSSNGSAAIQYSMTYTPCTTGTGTYNARATVTRIW